MVFEYQNRIVPGYINEIFKLSLCRYSTISQMVLDIPLRKTNTDKKGIMLSKINPSINNVKTMSFSMHALEKNVLFYLKAS